jgi:two-component sensor histidine kinase
LQIFFPIRDGRDWRGYLLGAGIALLAALLQYRLAPVLDPFVTFLAAVSLSAFLAGTASAVLTAALGLIFLLEWPAQGAQTAVLVGAWAVVAAGHIVVARWFETALGEARAKNSGIEAELNKEKVRFEELQHRVGNHMQVVASILTLQKAKVRADPSSAISALDETRDRVVNMSRVHRRLYDPSAAGKSVREHLQELCGDFVATASRHRVICSVASEVSIADPLRLMTLSLLVGEAINNSMKHAFADDEVGTISVDLKVEGDLYVIEVHDNGHGLASGFEPLAASGLGFKIMQSLAGQLGGRLEVFNGEGATIRVTFGA